MRLSVVRNEKGMSEQAEGSDESMVSPARGFLDISFHALNKTK